MYIKEWEKAPSLSKAKIGDVYIYPDKVKVVCHCDIKGKKIVESTWSSEVNGIKIDLTRTHPENMRKRFDLLKENLMLSTSKDVVEE